MTRKPAAAAAKVETPKSDTEDDDNDNDDDLFSHRPPADPKPDKAEAEQDDLQSDQIDAKAIGTTDNVDISSPR